MLMVMSYALDKTSMHPVGAPFRCDAMPSHLSNICRTHQGSLLSSGVSDRAVSLSPTPRTPSARRISQADLSVGTAQNARRTSWLTCSIPAEGVLANSDEAIRLANGELFCLRYPDQRWSREIEQIADALVTT